MDDQQKDDNQDLTMNMDGTMTTDEGQKIEVTSAPALNDIEPPAVGDLEITGDPEEETDSHEEVAQQTDTERVTEPVQPQNQTIPVAEEQPIDENDKNEQLPSTTPTDGQPQEQPPAQTGEDQALAEVGVAMSQTRDKHSTEHRNNKKVAVIVTVITAVLLAGLAVYVYLSANNTAEPSASNNSQSQSQTAETQQTPATVEDVDTVTQELETAIDSVDTTTDFDEAELSDQSLGL